MDQNPGFPRRLCRGVLALACLWCSLASALPFTLYLSGSMETITSNAFAEGLRRGDRFDLALTLDPSAVTASFESSVSSQPDTKTYFGGIAGLTGMLAGVDLALGTPLAPGALNPAEVSYRRGDSTFPDKHIVQFAPALDSVFGNAWITRLFVGFQDNDGTFLTSTDFTADPFAPGFLADLEQATVQFQFQTRSPDGGSVQTTNPLGRLDYAALTPPASVPVPGSALLVLAAMVALAAVRRMR